jgi:hypothetical protein
MKNLFLVVPVLLVIAAPARASQITMDFSGTVDLSGQGGPASNSYSGSLTWDTAASPSSTFANGALYHGVKPTFIFDAVDETANVDLHQTILEVTHNNFGLDQFVLDVLFNPSFDAGGTGHRLVSQVDLFATGPTGVFTSTALPGDLDFLAGMTNYLGSVFYLGGAPSNGTFAPTPATPTPEPASLTLMALGLAGAARYRRRRPGSSS